jgi:hypothetical protein
MALTRLTEHPVWPPPEATLRFGYFGDIEVVPMSDGPNSVDRMVGFADFLAEMQIARRRGQ